MVVGAGRGPLVRASLQVSPCAFFIMGCQLVCLFENHATCINFALTGPFFPFPSVCL